MRKLQISYKLWITWVERGLLLALVVFFCSYMYIRPTFGQTVELTRVEKLTVIGERYANVFLNEKEEQIEEEITKEDYEKLALPNAKQPIKENYQYLSSYGGQPITIPTVLKDNEYYDLLPVKINEKDATGTEMIMMKFPGLQPSVQQKKNFFDEIISWIKSELKIPTAYAAIASDAGASGSMSGATSLTYAHTVSGSNLFLAVYCSSAIGDATEHITGITYNGDALTKLDYVDGDSYVSYVYYLINPDTGTHNIVVSTNATDYLQCASESYAGVKQSAPEDMDKGKKAYSASANRLDLFATSTLDNFWIIGGFQSYSNALSEIAGTVYRVGASANVRLYDRNTAITPAGQSTLATTITSGRMGGIAFVIAPYIASSTPPEATTTSATIGQIPYNNELTLITGYEEIYTTSTTTPSEVRYVWYHVPFIAWIVLGVPTLWIFGRFILELIIRMRMK
jgi:hypothetical protein